MVSFANPYDATFVQALMQAAQPTQQASASRSMYSAPSTDSFVQMLEAVLGQRR
jgi:hypothetical protein